MSDIIKCLIIDDEPLAIRVIEKHLEQMPNLHLVKSFQNPLEAFDFLKKESIDLIFLDIQMPVLTGLDFAQALHRPPGIIFTTAYRNYAVESYELEAIDYLVKPVTFTRFFKAVQKFLNHRRLSKPTTNSIQEQVQLEDHLYVNENKKYIKVAFQEIQYVESLKDYIRIHTQAKRIITKDKISEFEQKLPDYFLRVHRSFIVNLKMISAFTAHDVEIGAKEIPIGGSYKEKVLERLK